ncbi:FG-GAP-like repeat-containing protein [bacterium]|nr:FG-GAP-like repeat-containing protein [bacterium]
MTISQSHLMTKLECRKSIVSVFSIFLLTAAFGDGRSQPNFTKITSGPVVTDQEASSSCSWADYDNDGDLDLFVTNASLQTDDLTNVLYQNNGDGSFTRLPLNLGIEGEGANWGDFDNDGNIDVFVEAIDTEENLLYKNNGDGSFTSFTTGAIVAGPAGDGSWGDFDNDGHLDLFVGRFEDNALFYNNGDGSFVRETTGDIVNDGGDSNAGYWGDYDNDGDLDVFITNQNVTVDFLYENRGNRRFNRITQGEVVTFQTRGRGGSWGDYDNDGDLDLFATNGSRDESTNNLFTNNGDGTFTHFTNGSIDTDRAEFGFFGSGWADYDNDGDLDVVAIAAPIHLYENNGDGSFSRVTSGAIVSDSGTLSGDAIWGDYDNDGDLELFVTTNSNNLFYRNEGNDNSWINIKCVGTLSNRSAIGTKVRAKATISGKHVWQLREISARTGLGGQNSLRAHFGLGDATNIDTVRFEWPSGQVQLLTNVAVNQFLAVKETRPPRIEHTPPGSVAQAGSEVTIDATISATELAETKLLFRPGGDTIFTGVAMSDLGNGSFRGTIPSSQVTSWGVQYRFVATDIAGNVGRLPLEGSFSIQVNVPTGISRGQEEPFGSDQSAYHIFSVPLDLQDKTPAAILEDNMGEYDESRWRFLEYLVEEQTYVEFPEIEQLQSGKGYWFLVTEPARIIDTPGGTSFSTAEPFGVIVRPGWNLIGNPFNFIVPGNNVKLQLSAVDLRTFNGSWNNPITDPVTEIRPFEGYAYFFDDIVNREIFIDPNVPVANTLAKPARAISWSINVQAQCQQARDVDNVLGVSPKASESWDRLDYPEPPPMGEYVSVYFPRSEWGNRSQGFCTDFRPAFSQGGEWEFEVQTNIRDRVELTFTGIESVPQEFDVWLVDEALGLTQNLRNKPHFFVAGVGEDHPNRLKLLVGRSDFVNELLPAQEIPTDFELSQNFPNPFNPVTSIRYGLPREANVTLKIFNILGEEVTTLLNEEPHSAGFHIAIWDGRNRPGRRVASGVYLYQLIAGDLREMRKMVLVR